MTFNPNTIETPEAEYEKEYHGHPNYRMVFIGLIVLLGVALVADMLIGKSMPILTLLIVFGTALAKALMVIASFMHLKYEPKLMWFMLPLAAIFALAAFFFGVLPDVREGIPLIIAK